MRKLLFLILLFTTVFSFGQEKKELNKMSYKKFIEFLEWESKGDFRSIRGQHITLDAELIFNEDSTSYKIVGEDAEKCTLNKHNNKLSSYKINQDYFRNKEYSTSIIGFEGCKFDALEFVGCTFNSFYLEKGCEFESFIAGGCKFRSLYIDASQLEGQLILKNCEIDKLTIKGSSIKHPIYISGKVGEIVFSNNEIYIDSTFHHRKYLWFLHSKSNPYLKNKKYNPTAIHFTNSNISSLSIDNNKFRGEENELYTRVYNYNMDGSQIGHLLLKNENIQRLNTNNLTIENSIKFDSVNVQKDFSAYDINLPEFNLNFKWNILRDKLNFSLTDSTNYGAKTIEELSKADLFDSYITTLMKFFKVYKNKGDLESANACYVEMKNAETRRLKYLYDTYGGSKYFLNYHLNRFLKYFAEYGTNPVRSIQISGWVILIFAFFYFFFYSDWDRIDRKYLVQRGNNLISYFRSEQKLEDIYSDKHKDDLFTYTQFKQNLKESKTEVPFFFMVFLKPLYWVSVIKHKFNSFLYRRVEFLQGRWSDLTNGKKWLIGTLTFLSIITYGLYLIVVRSLNSLILSINTFTTLGFGDIPVVGISRYVAILEGFLGWFLLSIFSVSLISQILQN